MNNQWVQSANNFFIREVSQNVQKLAPAIYKMEQNPMSGEVYLSQVLDKYEFPYKVYGIETKFINRVKKTYDNTTGNLGILLNGIKGTGKTVTSKQICNELGLPVIIVHHRFEGNAIPNFINDIQQDVIIFVDEYEKIYGERDHSVLTIMDGAMDNGFRKVFLLTTNNLYVNENLIQRPGRIRYLKTFGHLSAEVINEIVGDKLKYPELKSQVVDFIIQLETITVDIVKAIVDEVNIHNEIPSEFKDVFNIKVMDSKYNVYELEPGKAEMKVVAKNAKISPIRFSQENVESEDDFYIGGLGDQGVIVSVIDKDTIQVKDTDYDDDDNKVTTIKTYVIEEIKQYHYNNFAF
jgi:broad-specificity NMP kinase